MRATTASVRRGRQPELDGVRAIAVLAIVGFHATSLLPGAYVGVDLFFVLSGFLITRLLVEEVDRDGGLALGRFYLRRALRLLPALVLLCAVVGPLFALLPVTDGPASLVGTVGALTYTSSPMAAGGVDLGWMLHTWSLSVEEWFYLVWPVMLGALASRRHRLLVVCALALAAVVYRLGAGAITDWSIQRLAYAPDTRAEQLLIGAAAALLLVHGRVRIGSGATVLAALVFPVFSLLPDEYGVPFYYHFGGSTLIACASAVLVLGLTSSAPTVLSRIVSRPVLTWVGERSYGIYLWNLPIVAIVAATPIPGPAQLPVKLVLTFVVPALSYRYVEKPFLRLKDRPSSATPAMAVTGGPVPASRPV